jgi:hypothetical protein
VPIQKCKVSFVDRRGVSHSVEVQAGTVFEAICRASVIFKNSVVEDPTWAAEFVVEVVDKPKAFRVNCESVPMLPAWAVREVWDDPRHIPYLLDSSTVLVLSRHPLAQRPEKQRRSFFGFYFRPTAELPAGGLDILGFPSGLRPYWSVGSKLIIFEHSCPLAERVAKTATASVKRRYLRNRLIS